MQAKASRKERHMTQGGVEPSPFRLRSICSTDWARPAWCETCARQSSFWTVFREKDLPRESNTDKHRGQEPRELTVVQPLYVAKPLKRAKWHLGWRQVKAPLFGGSRPLTAQKGVQHLEKGKGLSWCGVAPFLEDLGRSRLKKGSGSRELKGMCCCCCCWGAPPK